MTDIWNPPETILIYGSSFLTELVVNRLKKEPLDLIGYVPCVGSPTIPGNIDLPKISQDEWVQPDIAISIQYDRIIPVNEYTFNLHTGLLPEFGGRDILRHTLKENKDEQGLTFHQIDENYDSGKIISKITYPVVEGDDERQLYKRQCCIAPDFVISCLKLISCMRDSQIKKCHSKPPRLLERDGTGKDKDFSKWKKSVVENLENVRFFD